MPNVTDQDPRGETLGVILAGGKAQRLGLALKSGIQVAGQSLLERVVDAIRDDCRHILLSVGRHHKSRFHGAEDLIMLSDPGNGPASALKEMAAFAFSEMPRTKFLLTVAVDTPFFPVDFAVRAHAMMTPELDAIIAGFGDQVYPTNGLWRLSSFARKGKDNPSAPALYSLLDKRKWAPLDYSAIRPTNPFVNINTPADLIACNKEAKLHAAS
ncbi:MAG TPA: hypothetical protein ENJ90_09035 [Devosia sp.]|nr:hypothetical protein [Devosia sp.]